MDFNRIGRILNEELEDEPMREPISKIVMEVLKWELIRVEQKKPHGARDDFSKIIDEVVKHAD